MAIEQTLVLIKPDGVQRGLVGEVIRRFEQRGLKISALKMVQADEETSKKHYTDDISKRRGEHVRKQLIDFFKTGPVVAMVIEGVDAIENVRKLCGATESKAALPGTIRGDFSHVSYSHADEKKIVVKNIIHASSSKEDAKTEISVWFNKEEIHTYKRSDEEHVW
ncbi:Nucleoside diphosphate kinase [uncultured archaeon]|nr:Nucleoside diphosphate kinase [uncultured archaeon]